MSTDLAETKAGGWILQLTCCGRDDGTFAAPAWEEADQFREDYLSGCGVSPWNAPAWEAGHRRSAIIVAGCGEEQFPAPPAPGWGRLSESLDGWCYH